jgi:hypothetical protein
VILPLDQAKQVARGTITILYLPVTAKRPKTGSREPIQVRRDDGRETHCHILIGMWQVTTLRPLLKPEALNDRKQAGWRLGDGIVQMCDEWMRRYDKGWPPVLAEPCTDCDQTGEVDVESGGWPGPSPDDLVCAGCGGAGWLYIEDDITDRQIIDRFEKRHADRSVYAIIVTVDHVEQPRNLTPASRPRGDDLGYTTAAWDELDAGAAIPVADQNRYSKQASARDDELRKARGEGRDMRSKRFVDRKRAA